MNEIGYFKIIVFYSGDVTADVDHLHIKRIFLVDFSYIVIDDDFTKWYKIELWSLMKLKNL
jgi:hypothetical protein